MCCKQPFHGFAKEAAEKETRGEKCLLEEKQERGRWRQTSVLAHTAQRFSSNPLMVRHSLFAIARICSASSRPQRIRSAVRFVAIADLRLEPVGIVARIEA